MVAHISYIQIKGQLSMKTLFSNLFFAGFLSSYHVIMSFELTLFLMFLSYNNQFIMIRSRLSLLLNFVICFLCFNLVCALDIYGYNKIRRHQ